MNVDNWSICPKCKNSFGWNNCDGLVGQMCSCGYMFSFSDRIISMNIQDDQDDDLGGCESFCKQVTPDIKYIAEEMAQCIWNCDLNEDEMTKYIANMLTDINPTYKDKRVK